MDKDKIFEKNLDKCMRCPITTMYMESPIIADDGYCYELDAIEDYHMHKPWGNFRSPLNRQTISTNFIKIPLMNEIITEFSKIHDCDKLDFYESNYTYPQNRIKIIQFLKDKDFSKLLKYTDFKLNDIIVISSPFYNSSLRTFLLKHCKNIQILTHVIDNSIDVSESDARSWNLLHHVCHSAPKLVVLHVMDMDIDIDLNSKTYEGHSPLHLLCEREDIDYDMIENLISRGADPYIENGDGMNAYEIIIVTNPCKEAFKYLSHVDGLFNKDILNGKKLIHFICEKSEDIDLYQQLFDMGVDFNVPDVHNITPIMYLTTHCKDIELFKFMVNTVTDLEAEDATGWRLVHYVCRYGTAEMIEYILFAGFQLNVCTQYYGQQKVNYFPNNMVELNNKITEDDCEILVNLILQMMQIQDMDK